VNPAIPRRTRAVIDVGTNSVKLLVAHVSEEEVAPLLEDSEQTRLGRGFYETQVLQTAAIEDTARAVADFVDCARRWGPDAIRVIATSAARDALNAGELIDAVRRACDLPVEIITGEQEADWAFQGVTTDPALRGQDLLVVDVGGGSTEFILGRDAARCFAQSYPVGTVRLLERKRLQDPPSPEERAECQAEISRFFRERVAPDLKASLDLCEDAARLVGTGGTTTILGRMELRLDSYERALLEGLVLTRAQIAAHEDKLWSLPLYERRRITGLPAKRADVILTGVLIFGGIMDALGFDHLRVSTRGLRFAAVR
jgi:exopolyphosphatase/guanosine-5'-triphosphate,3'-diphosphate pyrophosphatase